MFSPAQEGALGKVLVQMAQDKAHELDDPELTAYLTYDAIRWQEWVFTISQTSRPGASWRASRAARVRWTSISTPTSTRAAMITSRRTRDVTLPGSRLRALSPSGRCVASRISPARMPIRRRAPASARTRGVSSSTPELWVLLDWRGSLDLSGSRDFGISATAASRR